MPQSPYGWPTILLPSPPPGKGVLGWPSVSAPVLYDAGAEFAAITSGWQIGFNASCTLSKQPTFLSLASPSANSTYGTITTSGRIDLSPWTYLKARTTSTDVPYQALLTAGTVLMDNARNDPFVVARAADTTEQILTLNISNANGLYYVRAHIDGANFANQGGNMQVHKVWLES